MSPIKPLILLTILCAAPGAVAKDASAPSAAAAAEPASPAIVPARATVAILPVVNKGGEKKAEDRARQSEAARAQIARMFTERGFPIADPTDVAKALQTLEIDLEDEEMHNRATLFRVGEALNVRLVIFSVITDTDLDVKQGIWAAKKEGKSKVKSWLLDVEAKKPLVSAQVTEGKSGRTALPGVKGQARVEAAISNAVRDTLKPVLEPYPIITKPAK